MIQKIDTTKFMKSFILFVVMLLAVGDTSSTLVAEEPEPHATLEACQKESQLILLENRISCGEEEEACLNFGHWLPWYLFPDLIRGCKENFTICNRIAEEAHERRLVNCSEEPRQVSTIARFGELPY